jgi:uncharacterized membrane protein YfcA
MSMLPAFMPVQQAAAISTIYGLLVTIGTFVRYFRDYNWRLGLPFLISMAIGVPLGVYFLDRLPEHLLLKVFGALMIYFMLREFLVKKPLQHISTPVSIPFGLFSGTLSGAFNLGGIPTATYAYAHKWTRGEIMAFIQVMLLTSCTLRLLLYRKFGYFKQLSWTWGLLVLVPLFGAMASGHYLTAKIPTQRMRKGIFIFIGLSGIYYLFLH